MSFNARNQVDYTQRYKILSGRVNFAYYSQKKQLINEGRALGLNLYPPDNDASIISNIEEGIVATTPEELARYLEEIKQNTVPSDVITPTATVPSAPTSVSASAGNAEATVSFTPGSDGGSAITGYTVTSSPGGFTGTGISSPIIVTGLTNGTAYTFTVIATNSKGDSVASSPSSAVTPTFTDAISASLTTSLSAYNAAANGDWVKITTTEYGNLKTNVSGTTQAGISDAYLALVNGSGLSVTDQSAIVANTVTTNTPAIPANTYVYACAIAYGGVRQATDMRVFTNTSTTSWTGFNQLGGVLPATTTGSGIILNCYVLKGSSTTNGGTNGAFACFSGQTASSIGPLGFYQNFAVNNSMRYLLFTPGGSGGIPTSSSSLSGNLPGYGAFCIQALATPTIQWT
jgi:hypothetical protein